MRRLCFLVPDVDSAHGVVGDLRANSNVGLRKLWEAIRKERFEGNTGFRSWMAAIHDCAGEVLEQKLHAAR